MIRLLYLLILAATLVGCQANTDSTPTRILEGDDAANYARVFREPVPQGVKVVHSVVAAHASRPEVVTTDDFEFELLLPNSRFSLLAKRFGLYHQADERNQKQLIARRKSSRPWYAPEPLGGYEFYRDLSSVGHVHMLVEKQRRTDGRRRVFISKH